MKSMLKSLVLILVLCVALVGCAHTHEWVSATCTDAETCTSCNETEGEPLGHELTEWETTKEPTCSEEGERAGVCKRCNKECKDTIEKLAHTKGKWKVKKDYVFEPDGTVTAGTEVIACTVCKEEVEVREYTVELTLSQKNAVICAYDTLSWWPCGPDYLIQDMLVGMEKFSVADAKLAVAHIDVDWDEQAVLYASKNSEGTSKAGLTREMKALGFNTEQIQKALKEIGY